MSKFATLSSFMIIAAALFLFSSLTYAASPHSAVHLNHSPVATTIQHEDEHIFEGELDGGEMINCEGVGEEECLMRRTLVAHTDYIYTQKKNKP